MRPWFDIHTTGDGALWIKLRTRYLGLYVRIGRKS